MLGYCAGTAAASQISVQGGNLIGAFDAGFAASALGAPTAVMLGHALVLLCVTTFSVVVRPLREFRT